MAWTNLAQQNGKMFSNAVGTTSLTTVYTSPAVSNNVTGTSATAIVKEILICNTSTTTSYLATVSIAGATIFSQMITPNGTVTLSLNTMMSASTSIQVSAGIAGAVQFYISGMEVQ